MPSKNNLPEEDLLPFGALTGSPVDSSVREQLGQATNGKQKVQRSPRALRPLWYSIPILVIALAIAGYLIGLTLWSQSSLKHWKAQDYEAAQAGYEGQRTWTGIGIEAWVAHYNLGTTLVRQDRVDEGVAELRTAFDLVPKATEVQPGRLEPFSYECRVRVNLGIGLEIQGDQLRAAGSTADAVSVYQAAEDTIAPCQTASGGGGQSGDQNQSGGQSDQQSGGESNNPADENKERVGDKKQQTEEESQGQSGSQGQQQQQGQQGQQENPTPSPSPSENPYEGETQDQKERREQLENQNKDRQQNQRDAQDGKRDGNPNGAW